MNTRTSLGLFVVTALATRLLGGGGQDADVREVTSSPPPPPVSAPSPQFTQILRERLRVPVTPERGRNPFVYGERHSAVAVRREAPAEVAVAPLPPEPPRPIFKLSGIAASQQDGTTVLTAIVNDNGSVILARAGDKLSNGHSVVRVEETSITLIDATGVTQTLRLP